MVEPKEIIVAAELLEHLTARATASCQGQDLAARRDAATCPDRPEPRQSFDAPLSADERPRTHHRGPRTLHLHVGHDRLPKAANINHYRLMLACFGFSAGGHAADRSHVRLPADLSHGRRVLATGAVLVTAARCSSAKMSEFPGSAWLDLGVAGLIAHQRNPDVRIWGESRRSAVYRRTDQSADSRCGYRLEKAGPAADRAAEPDRSGSEDRRGATGLGENEVDVANLAIDLAKQEVTQARDRFQAGVANNIEVITAQDALSRANDNQIAALYRYNQARADLARATGQNGISCTRSEGEQEDGYGNSRTTKREREVATRNPRRGQQAGSRAAESRTAKKSSTKFVIFGASRDRAGG